MIRAISHVIELEESFHGLLFWLHKSGERRDEKTYS
jgi:hypothetical protein